MEEKNHQEAFVSIWEKRMDFTHLNTVKSFFRTVLSHSGSYSSETFQFMDQSGELYNYLFDELQNGALRLNSIYNRKFSSKLTLSAGLHYVYSHLSRDHSMEPRLALQLSLPGKQKFTFGYGLHSKNENLPVYFVVVPRADGASYMPNRDLEMTRSSHFITGYEINFITNLVGEREFHWGDHRMIGVNTKLIWTGEGKIATSEKPQVHAEATVDK